MGSEMCIRDSVCSVNAAIRVSMGRPDLVSSTVPNLRPSPILYRDMPILRSMYKYEMHLFYTFACPARPAAGHFSPSWLRGTQGARVYTTVQVWVPAGPRGPRSGRSKAYGLASNYGIAFRRARANRTHGNQIWQFFRFSP